MRNWSIGMQKVVTWNKNGRNQGKKVFSTASSVLGKQGQKHQDWFEEHNEHLLKLTEEKDKAR